jgi:lipopolysaccharide export system permease protein
MPILARYLFRQFLPMLLLCLAVCVGVLLMNQFLRLFNLAVLKGISPIWILSCFARLLPYFLSLAFPMAFLVALLLTLGQLSESGEILALRSSGFSFLEILWPYFAMAVLFSLILFYINHKASPEGFHSFRNRYAVALAQVSRLDLEPGTFTEAGDWRLFAKTVRRSGDHLEGIYLVKLRGDQVGMRVDAPEGKIRVDENKGFWLELYRGTMQMPDPDPARYLSATFSIYQIFIPLFSGSTVNRGLDLQELNTSQILDQLHQGQIDDSHRMEFLTEIALRSAGAMSPFVFFWLGCPLGLSLEKHARTTGFALSLGVLFLYYGFLVVGIGLGRRHMDLSNLEPWLPAAVGLAGGAGLRRWKLRQ